MKEPLTSANALKEFHCWVTMEEISWHQMLGGTMVGGW